MSKRNLYIIGGIVVFLVLAVGHNFTAPFWTAQFTKAEAKRMIKASLPEQAFPEFSHLKGYFGKVCGDINVMNGRGGYSGPERFVWEKFGGITLQPPVDRYASPEERKSQEEDAQEWMDSYAECIAKGW